MNTKQKRQRAGRGLATLIAVGGLIIGVAAPALAYSRVDSNSNWIDHSESARWTDSSPGYADSRVTTSEGCKVRNFKMTIREDRTWSPDPDRGNEWIDCLDYTDAVYATSGTDYDKKHHYDITGLGSTYNSGWQAFIPNKETFTATVRW